MTGGAARSAAINAHLAEAAQQLGIAMAVGSQRVALETAGDQGLTGQLRQLALDILLLANSAPPSWFGAMAWTRRGGRWR